MKEQPMPQAIEGLLVDISDSTPKQKGPTAMKKPSATSYHDDETKAEVSSKNNAGPKAKQSFAAKEDKQPFEEDFEPRPNLSVYND
ncbi:organ-specific protein S2 [Prunus yedoensis var. nudiflora]|uniref:Organ-specific protein S2 n=1 Tax=Prunus yedoensis var. nudiflora TaxID=2094558 RepID=A0A314Y1B9_PRUYE|nr:organ-specific protein S2 [Prunus yedoensis var. nudiflora]